MDKHVFKSYSFYGEDAVFYGVLNRLSWIMQEDLFGYRTYLDVGAHHPIQNSDTYSLYNLGWRGTLVEPNKIFNGLVSEYRNGDHLLNVAVSTESGVADFIIFSEGDSSNTLSQKFADRKVLAQRIDICDRISVDCMTLKDVIDVHADRFGQIPFILKLDIEGMDYDVMKTFPSTVDIPFISIEDEDIDAFNPDSKIRALMSEKGYAPVATSVLNTLYIKKDSVYYKNIKLIGHFEIENS